MDAIQLYLILRWADQKNVKRTNSSDGRKITLKNEKITIGTVDEYNRGTLERMIDRLNEAPRTLTNCILELI